MIASHLFLPAIPEDFVSHRRSIWQRVIRSILPAILAGSFLFPSSGRANQPDYSPQQGGAHYRIDIDSGKAGETVFSATNGYRAENKIHDLAWDNRLWEAAQQYAEFLAENKASGHQADGKTPQERANEKDYRCPVIENVFAPGPEDKTDAEEAEALKAFEYWRSVPRDNENMLSPAMIYTGVGAAAWMHEGQTYYVFVQMLGRECGGGAAEPLVEPAPGPAELIPPPVPACPSWDPDCRACPVWNPYCHRCPPWDPECRKCPVWNPFCHKCPPWDRACHKCPPWDYNCRKCPPWNVDCRRCPPSNPDCRRHTCPNGGIWPNCRKLTILQRTPLRWHHPRSKPRLSTIRRFNQRHISHRMRGGAHQHRGFFFAGRHHR